MSKPLLARQNERLQSLTLENPKSVRNYTVFGLLAWFFSALVAGWLGFFSQPDAPPFLFGLFILVPIAFFTALYYANSSFRAFAHSVPLSLLVSAHVWRYVGLGFVIAYLFGKLPPQFAIPEGLGDVLAAIFALPLARALDQGRPVRKWFVAWNVYGFLDLVSAITMGLLYSQGPLGILRTGASTALMTTFPVSLIPTFFVPLFILFHLLALARRKEVANAEQ